MKPQLLAAMLFGAFSFAHAAEAPAPAAETPGSVKNVFTGGNAEAGATKAASTCVACHGPGGNSANPDWPKLAGQGAPFIVEQLQMFKHGVRTNPVMMPQGAALNDDDMKNLAAYYSTQKPSPGVASPDAVKAVEKLYRAGDATRGVPACLACHGPEGAGNAAAGYPRIGGQHAKYAAGSLRRLRDMNGKSAAANPSAMATIAARLTENEIDALASYINGLQ
jgi:cytochrome c553